MTKQLILEPGESIDAVWVRHDRLHALIYNQSGRQRIFACDISMCSEDMMLWAATCEAMHEALLRATYRWAKRRPEVVE